MFKWLFHILIFATSSGKYQNKEKPLKRQRKLGLEAGQSQKAEDSNVVRILKKKWKKKRAILSMSLGFGVVTGFPYLPLNEHISIEVFTLSSRVDWCLPSLVNPLRYAPIRTLLISSLSVRTFVRTEGELMKRGETSLAFHLN